MRNIRSFFIFTNFDVPENDLENSSRKRSGNDFFASRHFSCLLEYSHECNETLSGRYQIGGAIFQGKYPAARDKTLCLPTPST